MQEKCKYCSKDLESVECPKNSESSKTLAPLGEILSLIMIFLLFIFPFNKKKKIKTCNNTDCIGFLEGCFGKSKGQYG